VGRHNDRGEDPSLRRGAWSRRGFLFGMAGAGATLASASALAAFLEACGNASTGGAKNVAPVKGGHLIEGSPQDILGLNPVLLSPGISVLLTDMLFEPLMVNDNQGNLIPALASGQPKVSSDGLTYTFSLRKDVKWSDGQPLTSDDVLFTFNLMFDQAYSAVRSPWRGDLTSNLASINAPDPATVVFTLKRQYAPFLATHAVHGIVPKHVLGSLSPAQINTSDFNKAPTVVSGVFKFVEWAQGDHVTLARNDSYYGGQSHLDQYVMKVVGDDTSLINLLKTGGVDCARVQTTSSFAPLDAEPSLTSVAYAVNTIVTAFFNLNQSRPAGKIFSSQKVRQALAYAFDRQSLIKSVYLDVGAKVADQFFLPNSWAFDPTVSPKYTLDTKKAEQLLDEDGWVKGSDGIRAKGGQKLSFEITTSSNAKEYTLDAQVMQQQWKSIGADVSVKAIAYTQEIQLANFTHAFDVIVFNTNPGLDPDLTNYWTTQGYGTGGLNASDYINPQMDSLFSNATATTDKARRKAAYSKISNILATDVPAIPIVYPFGKFYFNKRVHGMDSIGTYTLFGPRPYMKDVFVTSS